ncbi:MAG: YMGG-like glycine zipper-containing protein [Candidatus Hydrogenedentota bacterium]
MRHIKKIGFGILVLVLAVTFVGCETYGQSAGLGAALGAGTGAVIGHQSGHAGEGAAIGAALGGLTGLVVHDVKARRARSAKETAADYEYAPDQGEKLQLEDVRVSPKSTRPGTMVSAEVQYALLGTGGGVQVRERRNLLKQGQLLRELSSETFTRADGTWVSSQDFRLPNDLDPGAYTVQVRVETAQSAISGMTNFTVE